jgi:hypothetical protein
MSAKPLAGWRARLGLLMPAMTVVTLLYAAYFVWRYGGLWTENDTAVFAAVTQRTIQAGSVLFPGQYVHGFGYPDWLAVLALSSGISVPVLAAYVTPFLGAVFLAVATYVAFSALTGSRITGALALLLVLAVPELMFTVLRGNHEKLNIFLMTGALYALLRLMRPSRPSDRRFWLTIFWVCAALNVSVNDYFGTTFAVACTLLLGLAWGLTWRAGGRRAERYRRLKAVRRLILPIAGTWVIAWVFIFYIYPPALNDLLLLKTALARLESLALTLHGSSNPYAGLSTQWASPVVARLMAVFRWVVFLGSAAFWVTQMWRIGIRRRPATERQVLLLALYGAFSFLVAVAIPVDFVGLSAGANLEVRDYTYFALFAAPVLAMAVRRSQAAGVRGARRTPGRYKPVLGLALLGLIAFGTLKSTLDPSLSNNWMFYRPGERQATMAFWRLSRNQIMWVGPDDRLVYVSETWEPFSPHGDIVEGYTAGVATTDYLVSPAVEAATEIAHIMPPWPPLSSANRIYDDGFAQIYQEAPGSPFQP